MEPGSPLQTSAVFGIEINDDPLVFTQFTLILTSLLAKGPAHVLKSKLIVH